MPKYIRNAGKHWTPKEEKQLSQLAKQNTPPRVIGLKLGRPENGVRAKAGDLVLISEDRLHRFTHERGRGA